MSEYKLATRDAYGKALEEMGAKNPKLVVLDADLAAATKTGIFAKAYPERFFDAGIAEQNLIGVAAGLSTAGFTVFASSFAMFTAGRAFEQIRNTLGYPKLNVNIGATHAGISVGEDGASHQCCEDIALMRTIPGMTVINPADDIEARAAVFAAAELQSPCYLRFGRLAVPRVNKEDYDFKLGKAVTLKKGGDATIIATGIMVAEALSAAASLENEGISVGVINVHTIKPLDEEAILSAAHKTKLLVTAEEHLVIGGLGGAVAELVSEKTPCRVLRVGVRDVFGRSGPAAEMLKRYGLDAKTIAETVRSAV
jgi:transketolase